jgi:FHS family L-fucose permease-like MFS transporter
VWSEEQAGGKMELTAQMRPQAPSPGIAKRQPIISLVIFLFFARGFSTVLIDTLIPKLKSLFELSYAEAMLTQLCFFLGYLVFSLPAANILARIGYIRAIVLGLAIMATGCLIFAPAALFGLYPGFLAALFIMAAGITMLQVVTNPFIAALGPPKSSHSRLTLAQAFNSLGTTVGPLVGAWLILGSARLPSGIQTADAKSAVRIVDTHGLQLPFLVIAGTLSLVAVIFWIKRTYPAPKINVFDTDIISGFRLLKNYRFLLGVISIFVYVGAEVSIGSILVNYLTQTSVLSIAPSRAGLLASLYWGGAMCGRFIGSAALRIVPPGIALSFYGTLATLLAVLSSYSTGTTAAVAILAIGLFNSIMFPTIFMLALEEIGDDRPEGSGILCMAIVGGAVVPLITGIVADRRGLAFALLVPAACYLWIVIYGIYTRRHLSRSIGADLIV